ncbi:MAG: DNA polymerase/3'-5' exonuclease PolX [Candidatus Parvarchaeota archaeon]|jgi:DNA polymerase (family 10)|nr:DNA polymerase/3'-5' exonuclease PolX [Candidatus Parvarchaeota archaeon]MCL5106685.1 DNA polymerase/3'-5' exonuclease PolX [Candidatus Parvarchaeota archaeon]
MGSNKDLSEKLNDIADILDIEGVKWEPRAYRTAALTVSGLSEDISKVYQEGKLLELEGIGKSIANSIKEYVESGKISKYEKLKKKYPIDFESFRKIRGMGPKRAYALYKALGIKTVEDLKKAVDGGKIQNIEGFGEKSEEELKKNLESFMNVKSDRLLLGYVIDYANSIVEKLRKSGLFERVEIAGSMRRMRETIGDIDILAISEKPESGMDFFSKMDEVKGIVVKGPTKTTVELSIGTTCDIRILPRESFGAAMQYFTGNKDHNVKLRKIAISKGLKLNEYGLFRGKDSIAGKSEEEIYSRLGMDIMPPELRENTGEIEAAQEHRLPKIVNYNEILGDLHAHTKDSDGMNSLEEMASAAEKMGFKYIALTNHSKSLPVAHGLDEKRFLELNKKIDSFNEKNNIKILKGVELEILKDGSLDLKNDSLKGLDFVIGAMHQNLNMSGKELTNRLIKAINSGNINTVAHPTDRIIGQREGLKLDFEKVMEACQKNQVLLEIDGYPERSDLPFDLVKKAKDYAIKFSLGSDSHRTEHFRFLNLACAIARRGWLEKRDVINTLEYKEVLKLRR